MPVTQAEVARWLRVSSRTVRELRERKVIPDPAATDLEAVVGAYIEHLREMAAGRGGDGRVGELAAQRARLARAQSEAQELKNAVTRSELVPAGDQDAALIALATATSAGLQAIPAKVAPLVAIESSPATCEAILRDEIHAALNDLADAGRAAAERVERESDPSSPQKAPRAGRARRRRGRG